MDSLFFVSSKIVQFLIEPLNLIFIAICLALYFMVIRKPLATKRLLVASLIGFIMVGYAPIPESLTRILEDAIPKSSIEQLQSDQFAGIIILGGAISGEDIAIDRGEVVIGDAAERVTKGLELIRKFPNKPYLYWFFWKGDTQRNLRR